MSGPTIRAVVFKEGDLYVAQCIEHDICVQAPSISLLLERLDLTVEAEFATCEAAGRKPADAIDPAPKRFHALWEKRSVQLKPIRGRGAVYDLEVALTETTRVAA